MDREQEIIAALTADNLSRKQRLTLIEELERVGGAASIGVLRENLFSDDDRTAVYALHALSRIGTDEAVDAMAEKLTSGHEPLLLLTVWELKRRTFRRAMPALIRCLEDRRDELDAGVQLGIIRALAAMPHRSAVSVLAPSLRDRRTRRWAAYALREIRAPEARAALDQAAEQQSWLAGRWIRRAIRHRRWVGTDLTD